MTSRRMIRHTINHLGVVAVSKVMPLASLLTYSLFTYYIWIFGIVLSLNLHTAIGRFIHKKTAQAGELIGAALLPKLKVHQTPSAELKETPIHA